MQLDVDYVFRFGNLFTIEYKQESEEFLLTSNPNDIIIHESDCEYCNKRIVFPFVKSIHTLSISQYNLACLVLRTLAFRVFPHTSMNAKTWHISSSSLHLSDDGDCTHRPRIILFSDNQATPLYVNDRLIYLDGYIDVDVTVTIPSVSINLAKLVTYDSQELFVGAIPELLRPRFITNYVYYSKNSFSHSASLRLCCIPTSSVDLLGPNVDYPNIPMSSFRPAPKKKIGLKKSAPLYKIFRALRRH